MDDCIFCKIVQGTIPCTKVYEDEKALVFHDINPQAPVHVLIIPKVHIQSADALTPEDDTLLTHIFYLSRKTAKELNLSEKGYRLITNIGEDGRQSVAHLHFHLIGGRQLKWNN